MKRVLCFIGLASLVGCASGASSTGAVVTDYIPSVLAAAGVASAIYSVYRYTSAIYGEDMTKAKWFGAIGLILIAASILGHIAS